VTERRPPGSSAVPNAVPTSARTPCAASSPGSRDVSSSTFSWRSCPRRHAPAPSGTNVVASLTKRSGAGAENSVMMAQSASTLANGRSPARMLP